MRLFIAITFAALLAGCASRPVGDLPNFGQVTPKLARGGQPTAAGFRQLKAQGYGTVVKLNTDTEGSDDEAQALGMAVIYVPMPLTMQLFTGPTLEHVQAAVSAMKLDAGVGCYVHCEHGEDRTGLLVACYRVWVQHWTKADSEKEMLEHGFHKSLRGLWEFWEDQVK